MNEDRDLREGVEQLLTLLGVGTDPDERFRLLGRLHDLVGEMEFDASPDGRAELAARATEAPTAPVTPEESWARIRAEEGRRAREVIDEGGSHWGSWIMTSLFDNFVPIGFRPIERAAEDPEILAACFITLHGIEKAAAEMRKFLMGRAAPETVQKASAALAVTTGLPN
jgi:hypothetical protein